MRQGTQKQETIQRKVWRYEGELDRCPGNRVYSVPIKFMCEQLKIKSVCCRPLSQYTGVGLGNFDY